MEVHVVFANHVLYGVYTRKPQALALQETLIRDGIEADVVTTNVNEELDDEAQDKSGAVSSESS